MKSKLIQAAFTLAVLAVIVRVPEAKKVVLGS